jgi:hypothetical protein
LGYVPGLSCYGRENDQENDQADLRETHRITVTFCSRAVGCRSAKRSGAAAK